MPQSVLPSRRAWPLHDAASSRRIELEAAHAAAPHTLIERAGLAVARLALAIAPHAQRIWVAAGGGNNGGDGLIAARHLHQAGKAVRVSLFGDAAKLPPDARHAYDMALAAGVPVHAGAAPPGEVDLAIDALLGLGAQSPPRAAMADAIGQLNDLTAPVLAVDLPSGLPADTGFVAGHPAVRATHTMSLLTLKPGLFTADGRDHAGRIWFDGLGLDDSSLFAGPTAWLAGPPRPPARRHAQHKGSFGDVIVIGGAPGMAGAPLMAARAAQLAGAGRVLLAHLDESQHDSALLWPELMQRRPDEVLAPAVLARCTVVAGCGGGAPIAGVLPVLLASAARLVLDADALNALAPSDNLRAALAARAGSGLGTVLTPHPLEAARLLRTTTTDIQHDRLRAAQRLAEALQCTVVLKGSGSVIADPAQVPTINPTGSARLATAGSGDVLAGWIGGLWPAGGAGLAAASAGVWWHGRAAEELDTPWPLTATDLLRSMASATQD